MKVLFKNYSVPATIFALAIMLVALVMSIFGYGINYGIDFAGGLNITYNMKSTFQQSDVEDALRAQGLTDFKVSTTGTDKTTLDIRIPKLSSEEEIQKLQSGLETTLLAKYPDMDTTNATATYVGPVAGATLVRNAIISVCLASVLMLGYIAIRFDLFSGIAAILTLLHDVLIMISFMVILRNIVQMNSSFIAAMLTIVGYSINNSIVVFDRIRENNRKHEYAKMKREEVVNLSVTQCLGRTVNTTLTTLFTVVCLYIMGVASIREFTLPIIIGILAGLYSSVLMSGYYWAYLEERYLNRKKKAKPGAKVQKAEA